VLWNVNDGFVCQYCDECILDCVPPTMRLSRNRYAKLVWLLAPQQSPDTSSKRARRCGFTEKGAVFGAMLNSREPESGGTVIGIVKRVAGHSDRRPIRAGYEAREHSAGIIFEDSTMIVCLLIWVLCRCQ
jgi:hypothetical protein